MEVSVGKKVNLMQEHLVEDRSVVDKAIRERVQKISWKEKLQTFYILKGDKANNFRPF